MVVRPVSCYLMLCYRWVAVYDKWNVARSHGSSGRWSLYLGIVSIWNDKKSNRPGVTFCLYHFPFLSYIWPTIQAATLPRLCIKGFSPTIHDGALLLSLLNLVNQLLGSGSHFLARTRLERWSIFCGDGMVMVIFSQWWNGDGFWKCLTITIDGFWWDQPSATMVFRWFF